MDSGLHHGAVPYVYIDGNAGEHLLTMLRCVAGRCDRFSASLTSDSVYFSASSGIDQ